MPNIIDLFAGAGGLSLGACRAGFTLTCAVELDKQAVNTHKANFPNAVHLKKDIMKITKKEILDAQNLGQVDGIIGGPPCQGFSSMGQGNVNDIRNKLFIRFFEIVKQFKPKFFVAENVPGILNPKYNDIREKALNYVREYTILDPLEVVANEYGAPTSRKRIFFIGYLPNKVKHLAIEDFLRKKISIDKQIHVGEALFGLPEKIDYDKFKSGEYKIRQCCMDYMRVSDNYFYDRVIGMIPDGVGDNETIEKYKKNNIVTGCYPTKHSTEIIERYTRLGNGKQDKISKSQKLKKDGFCPTLRAGTGPEKGSYQAVRPIHYAEPRVITPREAARLQGFPDWFLMPHTIWHSFRQIGNSVSPIVAEQILSTIFSKL